MTSHTQERTTTSTTETGSHPTSGSANLGTGPGAPPHFSAHHPVMQPMSGPYSGTGTVPTSSLGQARVTDPNTSVKSDGSLDTDSMYGNKSRAPPNSYTGTGQPTDVGVRGAEIHTTSAGYVPSSSQYQNPSAYQDVYTGGAGVSETGLYAGQVPLGTGHSTVSLDLPANPTVVTGQAPLAGYSSTTTNIREPGLHGTTGLHREHDKTTTTTTSTGTTGTTGTTGIIGTPATTTGTTASDYDKTNYNYNSNLPKSDVSRGSHIA